MSKVRCFSYSTLLIHASSLFLSKGIKKKAREIQKYNDYPHLSHGGYELLENKLMDQKRKTQEQQVEFTENPSLYLDPPSPILRQMKWKMVCTKQYGQMNSTVAKEISDKIVSN